MSGYSLLTRIRNPELANARRHISDSEVRDSVLDHLRNLLSTRIGTCLSASDYGVLSISDVVHNCPDAIADLVKSVKLTIETYEPRLTSLRIKHVPSKGGMDDLTIKFEITAQIWNEKKKSGVKFQTVINSDRQLNIE
jgi:type VI secretion system protein